jgi:predicted AAA+ superfamily ATPase
MAQPTIFDLCVPRPDVLAGTAADADFAADLSHVVRGSGGPVEYFDPVRFFANTYPTRGLRNLLANVCGRLGGGSAVSPIFRLDTSFGGGKTHGLISLVHAARGMKGVVRPEEFVDPTHLPTGEVGIAAFDGENADPANGRRMGEDVLAYTPWGEIAYALAGRGGYERLQKSDTEGIAPGAGTIAELFGNDPALVLLDELSIYLRKVRGRPHARDQLTAFLTSLFKAVESSPRVALVYTLAVGKGGRATDAYSEENQFIADKMAEAESVSARKATLLNPTEDDETVQVVRRRLFQHIDEAAAGPVIEAYRTLWNGQRDSLAPEATKAETVTEFRRGYPFHPDVMETFTAKTATLANFQRVRGMLRILGRTVGQLWETRPADANAIHLHHIDSGFEPIRQEIVTRLGQSIYVSALRNDIAGEGGKMALAQDIDNSSYRGMPPYATYVARTIFMHTLAFNDQLKGLTPEHLRYSIIGPQADISFIEAARQKFVAQSAYLDDRPVWTTGQDRRCAFSPRQI